MDIPNEVARYFATGKRRLISVIPQSDYSLCLEFDDGQMRLYDLKGKLTGVLAALRDIDKFNEVFIDEDGNIAWDIDSNVNSSCNWSNRIDLSADNAYIYGEKPGG
jgi:hypothetical protein